MKGQMLYSRYAVAMRDALHIVIKEHYLAWTFFIEMHYSVWSCFSLYL